MHPITKLLTAAIFILALLSAGCTDTSGGSANSPTAVATATQAATAEPTPVATDTPIKSQHLYDIKPDTFDYIKIEKNDNLFGIEIEGSKVYDDTPGWERVYDDGENQIFDRETYTSFDHYDDLQPDQARALEAQYGEAELVVMEQADTDGDGALDTIKVKYVGSKGTFTHESDNPGKGLARMIWDFMKAEKMI